MPFITYTTNDDTVEVEFLLRCAICGKDLSERGVIKCDTVNRFEVYCPNCSRDHDEVLSELADVKDELSILLGERDELLSERDYLLDRLSSE